MRYIRMNVSNGCAVKPVAIRCGAAQKNDVVVALHKNVVVRCKQNYDRCDRRHCVLIGTYLVLILGNVPVLNLQFLSYVRSTSTLLLFAVYVGIGRILLVAVYVGIGTELKIDFLPRN